MHGTAQVTQRPRDMQVEAIEEGMSLLGLDIVFMEMEQRPWQ